MGLKARLASRSMSVPDSAALGTTSHSCEGESVPPIRDSKGLRGRATRLSGQVLVELFSRGMLASFEKLIWTAREDDVDVPSG